MVICDVLLVNKALTLFFPYCVVFTYLLSHEFDFKLYHKAIEQYGPMETNLNETQCNDSFHV